MPCENHRVLAIIPAYCEETHIQYVVHSLKRQGFDVLVIDDCSLDNTKDKALAAGARVVRLPVNLGYGGALQTGYLYARRHCYDAVVQLDGDGQHETEDAPRLLRPVLQNKADVVLGSRFLGDKRYPMPLIRRTGQILFGGMVRLVTGLRFSDPTSGYQALSPAVVELFCSELFPVDFPDADILIVLHRMGFRIAEFPVQMYPSKSPSMHRGLLRPLYYLCKMILAISIASIRNYKQRSHNASTSPVHRRNGCRADNACSGPRLDPAGEDS